MLHFPGWKLGLRGEVLWRDDLPRLLPAWEDLCSRAVEDNVYYSPRYAQSLLRTVAMKRDVGFAAVWDGLTLVALLPFRTARIPTPLLRPDGWAWGTEYTFSCTPLLDRVQSLEAADALLDVLASVRRGEWLLPTLNVHGEACQAMVGALERRGFPRVLVNHFERATVERGLSFEEHMQGRVSPKRRKELARCRRKLEALGSVKHQTFSFGDGLETALAAFLEIEARGWKGQRGTALACKPETLSFAQQAFTGDESSSICRADVLTLNDVPIAVNLAVIAGSTAFTVKGCFDENYRSYGAGLLLEVEVLRSFLSEGWASRLDAATSGAHVIDDLWPGRIEVADLMFSLSPRHPRQRLSGLKRTNQVRTDLKARAKRSISRWKSAIETRIK